MSQKLTAKYEYILLSAKSPTAATIDVLAIQQSLRSSLLQICGQTASAYIDVLAVIDNSEHKGNGGSNSPHTNVVIRTSPSNKKNVLAAVTMSGGDKNQIGFSVIRTSSFLPSLLPYAS